MKQSTFFRRAAAVLLLPLALCATARATDILNVTTSLTATDPSQLGRLSRNGIPQDWANTEVFPGVSNSTVVYHYRTFVIDAATVGLGPFIQISLDDLGTAQGNLFASAYFTSYLPNSVGTGNLGFDTHWLGDSGSSGNFFGGTDPAYFQVTVPAGASLVVVVANAAAGTGATSGIGEPFKLLVESFSDTNYTDAKIASGSAPDSASSALLLGLGLTGLVVGRRLTSKARQNTAARRQIQA